MPDMFCDTLIEEAVKMVAAESSVIEDVLVARSNGGACCCGERTVTVGELVVDMLAGVLAPEVAAD